MEWIFQTRGGQTAAQTRIEIRQFFNILGYFFRILLSYGPKSQYFWQIFQVAAHRPIWVGHP